MEVKFETKERPDIVRKIQMQIRCLVLNDVYEIRDFINKEIALYGNLIKFLNMASIANERMEPDE